MSNTIYQYYDLTTAISVLENKELWFSDIYKMNDYRETHSFNDYIKRHLNFICTEMDKKTDNNKIKQTKRNLLSILLSFNIITNLDRYISCFSKDGDLLSQWRSYADDGKGISIGYNLKNIEKLLKNIECSDYSMQYGYIDYLNMENKLIRTGKLNKKVKSIINNFPYIESIDDLIDDNILEEGYSFNMILTSIASNFINGMIRSKKLKVFAKELFFKQNNKELNQIGDSYAFFKNKSFQEEKEYRILFTFSDVNDSNKPLSKTFYRVKNRFQIVKYKILKLDRMDFNNYVNEIIIGPKCAVSTNELKEFLDNSGINHENINIKRSLSSYR